MRIRERFGRTVMIVASGLAASAGIALLACGKVSADKDQQDRAAIERLHALDVQTTLSNKAAELAKLWDQDAVRLMADHTPEVGKTVIYADRGGLGN